MSDAHVSSAWSGGALVPNLEVSFGPGSGTTRRGLPELWFRTWKSGSVQVRVPVLRLRLRCWSPALARVFPLSFHCSSFCCFRSPCFRCACCRSVAVAPSSFRVPLFVFPLVLPSSSFHSGCACPIVVPLFVFVKYRLIVFFVHVPRNRLHHTLPASRVSVRVRQLVVSFRLVPGARLRCDRATLVRQQRRCYLHSRHCLGTSVKLFLLSFHLIMKYVVSTFVEVNLHCPCTAVVNRKRDP